MSSSSSSKVDPLSSLNARNHGPAVILTAAIALGIATLTVGMRLWLKWPWKTRFKIEDATLLAAILLSCGSTAAVAVAVHEGFGTHITTRTSAAKLQNMRSALTATFALCWAAQGFAGCAFMLLVRSITPEKSFRKMVYVLVGAIAAWSLAAVIRFAVAGVVNPSRDTWIGFSALSVLFQVAEAATAIWLIFPLNMALGWKVEVSFWFVLCIPSIIAATVLRLTYTPASTYGGDYAYDDVIMVIILLAETNLMVISAGCCSFRSLLMSLSTGFLGAETKNRSNMTGHSVTNPKSRSEQMMKSLTKRTYDTLSSDTEHKFVSTAFVTEQNTAAMRGDARSDQSFGDEAILVRRSVEIAIGDAPTGHEVNGTHYRE